MKIIRKIKAHVREFLKNYTRSPQWAKVRRVHLKLFPLCAACGSTTRLQVHHRQPFHLDPSLELNPDNLITLCMAGEEDCHINIGHGDDFKAFNPKVTEHSDITLKEPVRRPEIYKEAKAIRKYTLGGAA